MKFGLSATQYDLLSEKLIVPLKQKGIRLWVFGSRARGEHKPFSDIDILFSLSNPKALTEGELFLIKEDLIDSNLPFKVDLVNEKELAPSYRDSVLRDRVEI